MNAIFCNKFFVILFISLSSLCKFSSQNHQLDSLLKITKIEKLDTNYVKNLIRISVLHQKDKKISEAKSYAQMALNIAEQLKFDNGIIGAYLRQSEMCSSESKYDSSIAILKKVISLPEITKNKSLQAELYCGVGDNYFRKGDYNKTLFYCMKSLSIAEQINNKDRLMAAYNGIGHVYRVQKNYTKALLYFNKVSVIATESKNEIQLSGAFNSLGLTYSNLGNNKEALSYYYKSLKIREKIGRKNLFKVLINIGTVYMEEKKYEDALTVLFRAKKNAEEIGSKEGMSMTMFNIAGVYYDQGKYTKAEDVFLKLLKMYSEAGLKPFMKNIYEALTNLYEKKLDYKQALKYQKLYTSIKDSMFNTESNKQITEMNTKYETELKDKELIKKDSEIKMQQANSEKQAIVRNGFIVGFIFLLGLIVFIYRGYVQKQKTNKLLNDKNQKITDSINYAKLIQSSILPSLEEIKRYLPQSFVFYQPKDIVSGDFYWLYPINDQTVIVAVVDCTGHGVPGAMMSMLGYSLLEQIVNQNKLTQAAQILDQLNYLVIESLKQSDSVDNIKNGMDMALFKLDYLNYELEYAGAKNPLYVVRDNNLIELKANRKSIGLSTGNSNPFTNQTIKLQQGDQIYAFSDGYIDQKGGSENKKFYSSSFQKLLISINTLNVTEQETQVTTAFNSWKGNKEQIDDVLVFGIKI